MQAQIPSPAGTIEDAARLLGVGRTLAYQEAKAGRLPGVFRIGRLYRVSLPVLYRHLGLPWPPSSIGPESRDAEDEPEAAIAENNLSKHRGRNRAPRGSTERANGL